MNKKISSVFAISIIALLSVGFVSAFQFGNGLMNQNLSEEEVQAHREEIRTSVENGDYSTWKALMEERLAELEASLTEENFNQIMERHQERAQFRGAMQEARESGDYSKMQELKEESGFGGMGHRGRGQFGGGCKEMGF
jgi:hypothetical protein